MFNIFLGIDETVAQVKALGAKCSGYKVDIAKKEEVYKAAEAIRENEGDVSKIFVSFDSKTKLLMWFFQADKTNPLIYTKKR